MNSMYSFFIYSILYIGGIKKGFGMHLVVTHKGGCPSPHIAHMVPTSPQFGSTTNQMTPQPTIQYTYYSNLIARIDRIRI